LKIRDKCRARNQPFQKVFGTGKEKVEYFEFQIQHQKQKTELKNSVFSVFSTPTAKDNF